MDELLTTRPADGPTAGPAGRHDQSIGPRGPLAAPPSGAPAEFEAARRRLGRSARETADRLGSRLGHVVDRHGLDRPELMAAQRHVRRLRRIGALPSAADYWENTAVPRAELLLERAVGIVDEETEHLGDAIERFLITTRRSTLEPWINGAEGRAAILRTGSAAIDRTLTALPGSDPIDELGEWWQNQLHRRAVVRAIPRLLVSSSTTEAVVGEAEIQLLDSPPWSYGDRLLSAFELAHSEVRGRLLERTGELRARVDHRGDSSLIDPGADGPAVIKLSG